jgi:hypothetical protein
MDEQKFSRDLLQRTPSTGFLRLPQVLAIIPISKNVRW